MADSRPLPGPCTRTCTRRTPRPSASRAACSAATVAANGVDFLEPLKPALPEEPHATVFPRMSVIVIVVLLNVASMCATPSGSTTRFVFFPVAILLRHLLLAGDGAAWSLLGARVCVRALPAHRQTPAMPDPTVRTDVHQSLDVHGDLGSQRALDAIFLLDHLSQTTDVGVGKVANALLAVDTRLGEDVDRVLAANAVNVGQANLDLLVARKIDAGNTSHMLALTLLVLGIALAD